jgi:cytochrome c oxidase assembly factor CtaG
MTLGQFLISGWTWGGPVLPLGAVALIAYLVRFGRTARLGWFAAGLGLAALTLTSPLNALADGYLFSAHMAQHILLLLVVPALLLLGLPRGLTLAPRPTWLGHPLLGWGAGVGAMWLWHAPALCNAAVASRPIHAVQTGSLLLLASASGSPRRARSPTSPRRASRAACWGSS